MAKNWGREKTIVVPLSTSSSHLFDELVFVTNTVILSYFKNCFSNMEHFYFSGTNPQKLRLTLLNADNSRVLRVAIWYNTPQRLDVYRKGVYIYPTNARLGAKQFSYKQKDPSLPDDQFEPSLTSIGGANYYDRDKQLLYVVVRGSAAVDIRTAPVIQVKLGRRVGKVTAAHTIYIGHIFLLVSG